jgi:hypothetical protein
LIVISREYCERVYTNVERRRVLGRAINSKTEYILPLLVDDPWIQGLPKSIAYLDLRKRSIISVCEDVYCKLASELTPDGLGIPEEVDFDALEIGAPTATESARYLLLSEIRQCFGRYCEALRSQNGGQARELVSEATLDFYAEMGRSALYARAEEVRSLSLSRRLLVLLLRHRLTADELAAMNGGYIIGWAVEQGMIGEINNLRVRRVKPIGAERALAEMVAEGQSIGLQFRFFKERGRWRVDLLSFLTLAEVSWRVQLDRDGTSEVEFLDRMITTVTG